MLDLRFVRENPEVVKQNIRNKFQDSKLPLVDEVIELDEKSRRAKKEADDLRASRNKLSKEIGKLMGQGKKEEAEAVKAQVNANSARLAELEAQEAELSERILKIMMTIPNIIDPSRAHRKGRQRECGAGALWGAGGSGFRDSLPYGYYGAL